MIQDRRVPSRRRLLGAAALALASVAAAACAAPVAPRWTFGPAARTGDGQPGASPAASGTGPGLLIRIVAVDFAFDIAEFAVPAGAPFQIEFDHRDVGIPHNVAIYEGGPEGPDLFRGEIFSGAAVVTYDVPGLPPGTHHFICDPHPYMAGAVNVT
jgi:plastocyanin